LSILVSDLAGSERAAQLGEMGARLEESKTIDLSLSALAKVGQRQG